MTGTKPKGRHQEKRLTAAQVRTITTPGFYGDGNGLYLKVDSNGARRWIQRVVINGKRRDIGLGSAGLVTLAEARTTALENRKGARAGDDPIAAKRLSQAILTFKEAATEVHNLRKSHWRNDKHGKQWLGTLDSFAFPFIGSKRVGTITSADVLTVLTPIWTSHPETARRVKQRMGTVFKWAMAKGWRTDNPADAISQALPKHDRSKVQHRKALPYDKVGDAIRLVRDSEAGKATKLAFEFLVLTATRSGETRKARWGEFDLEKKVWTIPASRMKAKKEHRVPLTDRCLAILKDAEALRSPDSDLVFPGTRADKPLSDMTLSKLVKELGIDAVPHGFRSSFRDWAGESTAHPRQVIEFALAHVIKDKAEAAYARSDLFEKRRKLMEDWSAYLI
jgi:integrase